MFSIFSPVPESEHIIPLPTPMPVTAAHQYREFYDGGAGTIVPTSSPASGAELTVLPPKDHPVHVHGDQYMEKAVKHNVQLSWSNLDLQIKEKRILQAINGVALPGRVFVVMGPSGSGKTSLLHCLAGRKKKGMSGDVLMNTESMTGKAMRHNAGFVPQEDLLFGFLTVEESIHYAAGLQLRCSSSERRLAVEDVIQRSGLDGVRKTKVGSVVVRGVSGGEKRRVSIATEAVGDKPILFLDEPTSGLDSAAAFFVVSFLRRLSRENGTTVISTIHQPSAKVFELFDDLLILSYGELVYYGPAERLERHLNQLGHQVPPNSIAVEYALDLINADFAGDEKEAMQEHIQAFAQESMALCEPPCRDPNVSTAPLRQKGTSLWQCTRMLLSRGMVNATRNWVYYWVRIAMLLALAILAGTIWLQLGLSYESVQNRFGVIFFGVAFPCFMAVAGIPGFLEERGVVMREVHAGYYGCLAYTLSSTVIMIPFIALAAILYSSVAYWLHGFQAEVGHFFTWVGVFFSVLLCAECVMLVFPALIPIFVIALTFASFFNGFVMMLQGYFVVYDSIPKFWIWGHYLSYQKYALEALSRNEFEGLIFDCVNDSATNFTCQCLYVDDMNAQCKFRGTTVLEARHYEDVCITCWVMVMLGMALGFRIIFWLLLEWRARAALH